jgi:hypothetical protein
MPPAGMNWGMYDALEHDRKRIQRLKALAAQLERLPRSPARDRLLREALHRTVTVDTGVPSRSCWGDDPKRDPAMLFEHMALQAFPRFASQR